MHLLVNRKHCRNYNTEGGSATAIEMSDQGNDSGHYTNADNVVLYQKHQLTDNNIEHSGICHDTEVKNAEYKQCRSRTCAGKSALNQLSNVFPGIVTTQDKNQCQYHRERNERDTRQSFALKQGYHDGNDAGKTKKTYNNL